MYVFSINEFKAQIIIIIIKFPNHLPYDGRRPPPHPRPSVPHQ